MIALTLLAAAPALPLDKAGKYVAGAFIVFVAVIFVYVAIMATKLQRMEKELGELNAAVAARDRATSSSTSGAERGGEQQ